LYFYNARWYDPALGRFAQPDTIVPGPGDPQSLNRYAYVHNNPLRFSDPTGHREVEEGPDVPLTPQPPTPGIAYTIDTTYLGTGHYHDRPSGVDSIQGIIMHKTGSNSDTAAGVANYFQSVEHGANYLIDYDGTIYQLTEDSQYAHHAGGLHRPSEWTPWTPDGKRGTTLFGDDINMATIGVEVLGESGKPYTDAQKKAAEWLVRGLTAAYNIDPRNITSHELVSREGKYDGGEYLGQLRKSVSSMPHHY
ncbi:MAG: N-acetylmuramoyl-L-alanine amidase, partial [Anaerolineae bacterium]